MEVQDLPFWRVFRKDFPGECCVSLSSEAQLRLSLLQLMAGPTQGVIVTDEQQWWK